MRRFLCFVALAALACSALAQSVPLNVLIGSNHFCDAGSACSTYKFGSNDDVDTTAYELISTTGEDHAIRFDNTTFSVASTDADDTSAGSGAQTVRVFCFDEDFDYFFEDIAMNGLTAVPMARQCMLPVRLQVRRSGTAAASNEGVVWIGTGTFTSGVPAVKHGQIRAPAAGQPMGQSQMAIYAVRAGFVGCMMNLSISTDAVGEFILRRFLDPGPVALSGNAFPLTAGTHLFDLRYPLCFSERNIIAIFGKSTSGAADHFAVTFTFVEFEALVDGTIRRELH